MNRMLKRAFRHVGRKADPAYRKIGDAARDARDWGRAAEFYGRHLKTNPKDFAIWVQLGHALKETGKLEEADAAYTAAAQIHDRDADLLLSRGHLAKLRGDDIAARGFYHLSYAADGNTSAANELDVVAPQSNANNSVEIDPIYANFDPKFYWDLYFPTKPYDQKLAIAHYEGRVRSFFRDAGFSADLAVDNPAFDFYGSREELARAYGMAGGRWFDIFSPREFCLLSFDQVGAMLNEAQALLAFLESGIERLAPISFTHRFDVDFYRELHPHLMEMDAADLYRVWLTNGLNRHEVATPEGWLTAQSLELFEYPECLDWRAYASAHLHEQSGRWQSLLHLLCSDMPPSRWPLRGKRAVEFLEAAGHRFEKRGEIDLASACYEHTTTFGPLTPSVAQRMADIQYRKGEWARALSLYDKFHQSGGSTLWSCALAADAASKSGRYEDAFALLRDGKDRYGGEQPWLNTVETVVGAYFEAASTDARELYGQGRRAEADATLNAATAHIAEQWPKLLDLPTGTSRADGPVLILGTHALRQCTHYRIEQKAQLLEKLGLEYKIFDYNEVDAFIAELPGASAAIFYRVPAFPGIIKAILGARAQGVSTYYEIDDLIFDSGNYPDTLESFQGQIDKDMYQGLLYGTPLYRFAMALCDYGLASTPSLAREMKKVVRSGECFVVRNGLDRRNIGLTNVPSTPSRPPENVRIVYGSATLAHNQDFHDMAGPALCQVLSENPSAELVIIGHLALGPMFDPFARQITRIALLADTRSYWSLLAACDINLAVLAPGLMSDCKSEIKWLEAAVVGLPSLVSATATYCEVIEDGQTGLLADTPDEWTQALRLLVGDAELRTRIAEKARASALSLYSLEAGARALRKALSASSGSAPAPERKKKRILIVNVFYPPQSIGGATRVVAGNLDDFLENKDATESFEFGVAATDFDARPAYRERNEDYNGVPVFRVAPPMVSDLDWRPEDPEMKIWFDKVLTQFQPDLVHFHCVQRLTVSPMDACSEADIPYIVSVHDGWWLSDYQFLFDEKAAARTPGDELYLGGKPGVPLSETMKRLAKLREALNGAVRILTPSASFTSLYRQAGIENAETLANGLPDLDSKPRRLSATGRVRLGHIGDTSPHKGFDLVEAALRQGKYSNLEMVALSHARHGDQESIEIWGETEVRIRGRVPQDEVADLYANLDVLLAPSACQESYGLVTREAHAAGLWVVASDRGAIGEDVKPDLDGFIVDVSTPADLSQTLSYINSAPGRFTCSPPLRDQIRSSYDQSLDLLRLYHEVTGD